MTTRPSDNAAAQTAQARFDALYISSSEICRDLGITRPTVLQARRRGLLPDPIKVCGDAIYVWERDHVRPYLDAWRLILGVRRNNTSKQGQGQAA